MDSQALQGSIFSLRTFCTAMLAGWLTLRLNLSSPGTAMMSVYIVSQPFVGMTLSKGLYRMLGNLLGAGAVWLCFALFAQARELLVLALAAFFATSIYLALIMRDRPEAYVPLLAGYTAAIIAFPIVDDPQNFFFQATNRLCEIGIAVFCASILSAVVLPRHIGPVLRVRIDALLNSLAQRAKVVCTSDGRSEPSLADHGKMVAAAVELDNLRRQAVYDTSTIRMNNLAVLQLQGRVLAALSLLTAIESFKRDLVLRDSVRWQAIAPAFVAVAEVVDRPLGDSDSDDEEIVGDARRLIASLRPGLEEIVRDEVALLADILLRRLNDVLTLRDESRALYRQIFTGAQADVSGLALSPSRDRDHGAAAVVALSAFIGLLVTCTFWILTAWPNGGGACTFMAVGTATVAAADEPTAVIKGTMGAASIAFGIAAIYVAFVLPNLDGFVMLVPALALIYLPAGYLMTMPKAAFPSFIVCIYFLLFVQLTDRASQDFAAFVNAGLADMAGLAIAMLMIRLTRPIGVHWAVTRSVAATYRDLSWIAAEIRNNAAMFGGRMYDRINSLFTRLDPNRDEDRAALLGSLAAVRLGYHVIFLRQHLRARATVADNDVTEALAVFSRHLRGLPGRRGTSGRETIIALTTAANSLRAIPPDHDTVAVLQSVVAMRYLLGQNPEFFGVAPADGIPQQALVMQA